MGREVGKDVIQTKVLPTCTEAATASCHWQIAKCHHFKACFFKKKLENESSCRWKTDAAPHLLKDAVLSTLSPAKGSKVTFEIIFCFGTAGK